MGACWLLFLNSMAAVSMSPGALYNHGGVTPRRSARRQATLAGSPAGSSPGGSPSRIAARSGNAKPSVNAAVGTAVGGMTHPSGPSPRARGEKAVARGAAADADGSGAPSLETKSRGGPKINLPTAITIVRVVAVPIVAALFYYPARWVSPVICLIFILAAVTDWLDGYLARKMNLVSSFGAFLDPVADKLMVAAALVLLCTMTPAGVPGWAVAIPSAVIIGREITMSAIREWAAAAGGEAHSAVAVNSYGKWKTATQLVALSILLGVRDGAGWLGLKGAGEAALTQGGVVCLWASAGLALLSLWIYMAGVIKYMD